MRSNGTLLILGVASSAVLAARLKAAQGLPENIVLVDPEAESFLRDKEGAKRITASLSIKSGELDLHVFSVPDLRSSALPTKALVDLFPGISVKQKKSVDGILLANLLEKVGPLVDPLHLWIDAPGEAKILLELLSTQGLLQRTETIALRCGSEAYFEGDSNAATLRASLNDQWFEVSHEIEDDPDFPDIHLHQNILARKVSEFEAQRFAHQLELEKVTSAQQAAEAALAESQESLKQKTRAFEALQSDSVAKDAKVAKQGRDIEASLARIKELEAERDAVQSASDERSGAHQLELEKVTSAQQAAEAALAESQESLTQKTRAFEALQSDSVAKDAEVAKQGRDIEASLARIKELEAERDAVQSASDERSGAHQLELEKVTSARQAAEAALAESQESLTQKTRAFEALQSDSVAKDAEVAKQGRDIEASLARIKELEAERDAVQSASDERSGAHQLELEKVTAAQQAAEEALVKSQEDISVKVKNFETEKKNFIQRERSLRAELVQHQRLESETSKRLQREVVLAQLNLSMILDQEARTRREMQMLQAHCEILHEEKEKMRRLLEQLTPRLQEAAQHLKKLPSGAIDNATGARPIAKRKKK